MIACWALRPWCEKMFFKVKKRAFPVGRGQDFCAWYLSCLVLKACGLIAGKLAENHNGVIWSHFRPSSEVPGACTLHALVCAIYTCKFYKKSLSLYQMPSV